MVLYKSTSTIDKWIAKKSVNRAGKSINRAGKSIITLRRRTGDRCSRPGSPPCICNWFFYSKNRNLNLFSLVDSLAFFSDPCTLTSQCFGTPYHFISTTCVTNSPTSQSKVLWTRLPELPPLMEKLHFLNILFSKRSMDDTLVK